MCFLHCLSRTVFATVLHEAKAIETCENNCELDTTINLPFAISSRICYEINFCDLAKSRKEFSNIVFFRVEEKVADVHGVIWFYLPTNRWSCSRLSRSS